MNANLRKRVFFNLAMTAEALLQQLEDEQLDATGTTSQPEKEVSEYLANLEGLARPVTCEICESPNCCIDCFVCIVTKQNNNVREVNYILFSIQVCNIDIFSYSL